MSCVWAMCVGTHARVGILHAHARVSTCAFVGLCTHVWSTVRISKMPGQTHTNGRGVWRYMYMYVHSSPGSHTDPRVGKKSELAYSNAPLRDQKVDTCIHSTQTLTTSCRVEGMQTQLGTPLLTLRLSSEHTNTDTCTTLHLLVFV